MNKKRRGSDAGNLLYRAMLLLKDPDESYHFFADLCADVELGSMEQRFEVARLLRRGMSYNDILARTGASSATISRVNRSLTSGFGAYEMIFSRLEEEGILPEDPE